MSNARSETIKKDAVAIAAKYGIEVVGFLKLDGHAGVPAESPLKILPAARTMILLGKRPMDDQQDIRYQISGEYLASVDMMALDIAAARIVGHLIKSGFRCEEYASDDVKAWAELAGLGWVGRSGMFVSKAHGPRLKLKGILTEAEIGEPCGTSAGDRCGECTDCMKACPVGAITMAGKDEKKCAACPTNHRQFSRKYDVYAYCTACIMACPVGKGHASDRAPTRQAPSKKRKTP